MHLTRHNTKNMLRVQFLTSVLNFRGKRSADSSLRHLLTPGFRSPSHIPSNWSAIRIMHHTARRICMSTLDTKLRIGIRWNQRVFLQRIQDI